MGVNEAGVLDNIAKQTQSELILFFVILAVVIIVVMIPLYTLILKDRKHKIQSENDRLSQYMEREKRIIEVITANTTVMAGLKTTLERDGLSTTNSLSRIHERIDQHTNLTAAQGETMIRISSTLDEAVRSLNIAKEDVKRVLLIVDNIPQRKEQNQ